MGLIFREKKCSYAVIASEGFRSEAIPQYESGGCFAEPPLNMTPAYIKNARACCLFLKSLVHDGKRLVYVTKRLQHNVSQHAHDAKSLQHDPKRLVCFVS